MPTRELNDEEQEALLEDARSFVNKHPRTLEILSSPFSEADYVADLEVLTALEAATSEMRHIYRALQDIAETPADRAATERLRIPLENAEEVLENTTVREGS